MKSHSNQSRPPRVANPDYPPWAYLTSVELSRLCGVSMQTVWNWRVRGTGPVSVQDRSRRHWYRLADVLSWRGGYKDTPESIILAWVQARFPDILVSVGSLEAAIQHLEKVGAVSRMRKPRAPSRGNVPNPLKEIAA